MNESTNEPTNQDAETAAKARKKRYKKSLNLPKTAFAMRANLTQNEPQSQKRWDATGMYQRITGRDSDHRPFVFHDGPPYANGPIHVGHLLNKVLKDLVVRSRNLLGERCVFVPGWDCHGLPIEHKVMSELVDSGKIERLRDLDDDTRRIAIRRACASSADKFKGLQAKQMKRLLTLADYDDPYLTMRPVYEEAVLEVFAQLVEQGIVYRDLKPVHWSIANQTALAEAELEYQDREDPSVYVGFEAADPAALARAFGTELNKSVRAPSLLIWTTTPWTLTANMLIAVHAAHTYALARVDGQVMVVAKDLLARVTEQAGVEAEVLAEASGKVLVGLRYNHPFDAWEGRAHQGRVVAADYVTLEDGTGLVHTATGHGQEDYATGLREDVEVYCPVQSDGTYDDTVPEWLRGIDVWTANGLVVDRLQASGHLLHLAPYPHSYPHDWRSKTPVIFRCTEQWFVAVDRPTKRDQRSLRELALDAIAETDLLATDDRDTTESDSDHRVRFTPNWGRNRMRGMLDSRPDWCLSRQRSWGIPIPAFRRPDGTLLLTAASSRAVAAVFGREGSDAWFRHDPAALLAEYDPKADPEAPDDLDVTDLEKMNDIFDVWFESGSSWNAVLRQREIGYPADLYLEGSDQHRGWFQLSLLSALGATGRAPFRRILTHGFVVDKDGRKMSKSLGNTLDVEELLSQFGADVCRWWVSSLAFENDIKIDLSFFERAGDSYRKVRNTIRFLLSNLADFDPSQAVSLASIPPTSIDAWVLGQADQLRTDVIAAYRGLRFRQAHLALFDFCNETLSADYLDAVKDRLYCDPVDEPRRRQTQTAVRHLAELLCGLLAPILPHTADEAWRALEGLTPKDLEASVHVQPLVALDRPGVPFADARWPEVMTYRQAVLKALESAKETGIENPLDAGVEIEDPDGILRPFEADLPDVFGVSRVRWTEGVNEAGVVIVDLRGEPRCERSWRRDVTVSLRTDGGWLSDRDARAVGIV